MVTKPEISSSVPAALSQLKLNVVWEGASPSGFTTSRPGHVELLVTESSASLIGPSWAMAKTTMMMR